MAAPGPRKRSGPALCGAGWARGPAPAAPLGNGVPPHKRPKGPAAGGGEAPEDPFGDGDDFTADELEEIETLASQALSQDAGRGWGGRAGPRGRAAGQEPAGRCEGSGGRWGEPSRASPHGPPGSFLSRGRRGYRAAEGRVPLRGAADTARRDPAQGGRRRARRWLRYLPGMPRGNRKEMQGVQGRAPSSSSNIRSEQGYANVLPFPFSLW